MPRTITVAAAQTGPVLSEDMRTMIPTALRMIEQAAARGAEVLTFCELFLSPFFPNRLRADFDAYFTSADSDIMAEIIRAAARHRLALVLPFGERARDGLYNSAMIVDAHGRTLGSYHKTHIPAYFPGDQPGETGSYERMYFTPGKDLPVFDLAGCRVGVQICNDRQFPEGSRVLALKGAEIIFMPICYSVYGDPEHRAEAWEIPLRARAFENGVYVVAANKVGDEGVRRHLGRSMIVSPEGRVLAAAGTREEELLVQTLDLDAVAFRRKRIPWWRDRRPDLYRELVS
ncbi:MAG: carbon-nitrogen hydrolase family protein [Alphaproteobacteria bacterium]|nr:carbon-nitrogen hydrolase family protein [Alphaproteobacteria bacterium]